MMKALCVLVVLFYTLNISLGQDLIEINEGGLRFGIFNPLPCNVSVNRDLYFHNKLEYLNVVRSTFKIQRTTDRGINTCSATLVNRNVNQNDVGIYFVTAWHCFKDGQDCSGNEVDLNTQLYELIFNFQSRDESNYYLTFNTATQQKLAIYRLKDLFKI